MYSLKRLGKVLHLSNSKKLILKTKVKVKVGTKVLAVKHELVGQVFDIFGPITYPYVSIDPFIKNPNQYIGRILYTQT